MAQLIYGINPVLHALDAKRVNKIFILENFDFFTIQNKVDSNIPVIKIKKNDRMLFQFKDKNLQGILAEVKEYQTISLSKYLFDIKSREKITICMLDGIEDPHNFGAILRVCDAFSIDSVIYKKRNQVGITDTVVKVSTGAINYVNLIEVSNLNNAINELKKAGFWVYATDGNAKSNYNEIDYAPRCCVIIGSEGKGISPLVFKNSDIGIKINMTGHVNSLNASNAAAIFFSYISLKK